MRNTAIVERIFRADPESVYSTYWQLKLWPKVLRNILEVRVDYDDGVHQYFSMVVANDRDRETVRGVRIGTPYRKLELCQLSPPPGFVLMRGEWRFQPVAMATGTGTRVSAQRLFETVDGSRADAMGAMLELLLAKNLSAFDTYTSREAA
jgi:Polyketide cyclase / dehydrase and lipid transport